MKTITIGRRGAVFMVAGMLIASTILLNFFIWQGQAAEDNRVVANDIIPKSLSATDNDISAQTPAFQIIAGEKPSAQPGDKDMSMDEAGKRCGEILQSLLDVQTAGGKLELTFGIYNLTSVNRDMWGGLFRPADSDEEYQIIIDSITGQLYSLTKYRNIPTADSTLVDNQTMATILTDRSYSDAAAAFIKRHYPSLEIASSQNQFISCVQGSASMPDNGASTVASVVKMTDGSAYMLDVGVATKDILHIRYFPNGVDNIFTGDK